MGVPRKYEKTTMKNQRELKDFAQALTFHLVFVLCGSEMRLVPITVEYHYHIDGCVTGSPGPPPSR